MTIPTCPYSDPVSNDCSAAICTMVYSVNSGSTPTSDPALTISGTNFIIDATGVTSSLTARTITKTISVSISGNTRTSAITYNVSILITPPPCTITEQTVSNMSIEIGNRINRL